MHTLVEGWGLKGLSIRIMYLGPGRDEDIGINDADEYSFMNN